MTCGQHPDDCLVTCYAPHIEDARPAKQPGAMRGRCPACQHFSLSLAPGTRGSRIVYCCHAGCKRRVVRAALIDAGVPAGCVPQVRDKPVAAVTAEPRQQDHTARDSAMRDLIMDPDLPAAALRIGLLQLLDGLGAVDVQAKLRISKSAYYRAMQGLGRHRKPVESHFWDCAAGQGVVPKVGRHRANGKSPISGTEPQVRGVSRVSERGT